MLAVLAAVSALMAGYHANEAMLEQMKATDDWAFYQAKGIKANLLQTKMELLTALKAEGAGDRRRSSPGTKKSKRRSRRRPPRGAREPGAHGAHEMLAKASRLSRSRSR